MAITITIDKLNHMLLYQQYHWVKCIELLILIWLVIKVGYWLLMLIMEVRELWKEIVLTSIWNNIVRLKIRWRDRIIVQEWSIKEVV